MELLQANGTRGGLVVSEDTSHYINNNSLCVLDVDEKQEELPELVVQSWNPAHLQAKLERMSNEQLRMSNNCFVAYDFVAHTTTTLILPMAHTCVNMEVLQLFLLGNRLPS